MRNANGGPGYAKYFLASGCGCLGLLSLVCVVATAVGISRSNTVVETTTPRTPEVRRHSLSYAAMSRATECPGCLWSLSHGELRLQPTGGTGFRFTVGGVAAVPRHDDQWVAVPLGVDIGLEERLCQLELSALASQSEPALVIDDVRLETDSGVWEGSVGFSASAVEGALAARLSEVSDGRALTCPGPGGGMLVHAHAMGIRERAGTVAEIRYVLATESATHTHARCDYRASGGVGYVNRNYRVTTVTVRDVRTAAVVAEESFSGPAPPCPRQQHFSRANETIDVTGAPPDRGPIDRWTEQQRQLLTGG